MILVAYFKHSNTSLLEKEHLASQSTISRFLDRFTEKNIEELQKMNQALLDKVYPFHNDTDFIIYLDSTYTDTFGR